MAPFAPSGVQKKAQNPWIVILVDYEFMGRIVGSGNVGDFIRDAKECGEDHLENREREN